MNGGGMGGAGPRQGPGRDRLAVVRGGTMTRPGAPTVDQEPDAQWRADVSRWSAGKKVRLPDGDVKVVPWVTMELVEPHTEAIIHPIDYLPIGGEDYEWVVREIWEKCRDEAARADDGNEHYFLCKCWFADIDPERKFDNVRTYEKTTIRITIPRNHAEWGMSAAYSGTRYGRIMGQRPDPHHVDQEIHWMEMARGIVQDAVGALRDENRDLRREANERRQHEKEMFERERNLRRVEREERWEDMKQETLIAGVKNVTGRLGKVVPVAVARLSEAISDKISKKPPRTTRDENSYDVLTDLVRRAKGKVEKLARDAGNVEFKFTPEMLLDLLKNQFDIEPDDPIVQKLMSVLLEAEVQRVREEVEAESRMPGLGVVVEPRVVEKKEEKAEEKD
jgi:hypothetical protein